METPTASEPGPGKKRAGRPSRKAAVEIDARILDAATALFLERGVDGTSLEAVAARAAVSKPTLYARHSSKPDLFAAVIRANVAAAMPEAGAVSAGASPEARLRRVGRAVIEGAMRPVPLGLMRLYIAEAPRHGALIREVDRMGREVALDVLTRAILGKDGGGDADAMDRGRIAAGHFLDMAFVPHQVRMLLGDTPEDADPLHPTLDERIDNAVAMLKGAGLLATSHAPTDPEE